jgi:hypothetical protein
MQTRRYLAMATLIAALASLPGSGAAQAGQSALAKATAIKCTFSLIASSTLQVDPPKAEVKPTNRVLEFEAINADEGTAQLKSGFGQYDIIVRYAKGYLHFVQSFLDGPLHTTTILEKKTPGGKLKAMHSRHEYTDIALPTYTSSPEQYYGECEVVK